MKLRYEKKTQYITKVIKLFVLKQKQERFLNFIESLKRYEDFLDELFIDTRNLDPKCLVEIPNNQNLPEYVLKELQKSSVGKQAYVISPVRELDGKFGNIEKIVNTEVGKNLGIIIYCVETSLGYYEDDEGFHYILNSNKSSF
jgi:hypothetical protein